MPHFTRALAQVGASVFGVGDQPPAMLADDVQAALSDYLQVSTLWNEDVLLTEVRQWLGARRVDRAECLWEPGMIHVARLREALEIPGLTVAQTVPFRDKEEMKRVLDEAGLRTPKHRRCSSVRECWSAVEEIGYPIIVKPIDGAGSRDTHRVEDEPQLQKVLGDLAHVPVVSVEEFIDGEEYTFDTVSVEGKPTYHNIAWYRPRPLVARNNEWVSPQVLALRDVDREDLTAGVELGKRVLEALEFETGFTHMEWYRKADGEVVFGEIGARPPGAHQVDQMNYACDFDVFVEWANAIVGGASVGEVDRRYNVATVYKRAQGEGRIQRIEGLEEIVERYGEFIVWENLLPVGAHRRNWRQTLVSDGFIMLRHPDLEETMAIADEIGKGLQLIAG